LGGIDLFSGPNTIGGTATGAGNLVSGNRTDGIILESSATAILVAGNVVGLNATGTAVLGNVLGIEIDGSNNTVGGTTPGAGNLIGGNASEGVRLTGAAATGNTVEGDYIGTDYSGTVAIANGTGVEVDTGASGNTIGGTAAAARNIISGNSYGITLNDTTSDAVEGNYIGTDPTGSIAVGNGIGVLIWASATGNTIGGPAATTGTAPGNVISGNSGIGIFFNNNVASAGDLVEGNLIGTDAAGTAALANGTVGGGYGGFYILSDGSATHETIGGTAAADRNVISGNNGAGFDILNDNNNLIEGNYVGLDITGTTAIPNLNQGIQIVGSNDNTVGGTASGAGNVISGNLYNATAGQQLVINDENLSTQTASGNLVQGNLIGTNAAGTGLPSGMSFDYDGTGVIITGCATGNTIGGTTAGAANVIAGNAHGVFIASLGFLAGGTTSGNVVAGNDIGVEANGTTALANTVGVLIQSGGGDSATDDNTIGGSTTVAANIISGNTTYGIEITGSTATGNVVEGDYVGTDVTGTVAIANATGVEIDTGASGNTLGGLTATPGTGAGNVISGNSGYGVDVSGLGTASNIIEGDLIGTNAGGTESLGNQSGIAITAGSTNNTIGGEAASARNVISGNSTEFGVVINESGTTGNMVEGNFIGTDVTGTVALPNGYGILLGSSGSGNTIGGATSTPGTGAGNLISGNDGYGIYASDEPATDVILGNVIGLSSGGRALANGGAGISLQNDTGVQIGGLNSQDKNVISGNTNGLSDDVGIQVISSTSTLIEGNLIGTNLAGTAASPNDSGIEIGQGSANTIGGTASGAGNVVSGNDDDAVDIIDSTTDLVEGNLVGTDLAGTADVPNHYGVVLYDNST